ncbi:MAG: late competence development ComFB family protein [Treponema sp.]|nr:late competence development ComFB family protein [Treponema sp.]
MAFIDDYDFEHLKNEAENLVLKDLGRQLEAFPEPLCKCNDCVLDMAAMALNTVKPLYRVSLLGSLYTASAMDQKAYGSSVREAVFGAIEKVRKNPSHDPEAPPPPPEE